MEEPQCDGGTDAQTVVEPRRVVITLLQVWWPTLSCSREEGRKAELSCRSRPDGDQAGFDVLSAS